MTKRIMIQGTMSGVGKSLLCAGLCRIFMQDGYKVAPFKSQNMSLNSWVTEDGTEISRAQVIQAQAAGVKPDVRMNPILLKPTSDFGSEVLVNGKTVGHMKADEYFQYKKTLIPKVMDAFNSLSTDYDMIVIEGAGSPAEINLRENDIVNMGLAEMLNAPVLLVGDIDRGGVFAQLYGTVALLKQREQRRIEGLIINKFRGDMELLRPGLKILEDRMGIPVTGVVPYLNIDIDDEDSMAPRLVYHGQQKPITIAVVRLPKISNFTDFAPLEVHPQLGVRYVTRPSELNSADMVIIPGTKSVIADLNWLKENGFEDAIKKAAHDGKPILGVCGGYQILGETLNDPYGTEGGGQGVFKGIGLLPVNTIYGEQKTRSRCQGTIMANTFYGVKVDGFEIRSSLSETTGRPFCVMKDGRSDGCVVENVFGTYLHGLFDTGELTESLVRLLSAQKRIQYKAHKPVNRAEFLDTQYDILADAVRAALDMDDIYSVMEGQR